MFREIKRVFITFFAATVSALALHIFVLPANFVPNGIDGIATMLEKITGISLGFFTAVFNIPLIITAWFILRKKYVIFTMLYTTLTSILLIVLKQVGFYQLNIPDEKLLVAIISGAILGIRTGIMLKIGASTGGVDIIASCIQKYNSHIDIEKIITLLSCCISVMSIFVYRNIVSVMLSLVQMYVYKIVAEYILKDTRNAVKFEIVTRYPDHLTNKILSSLKHGVTILKCQGGYTKEENYIISTIINIRQIPHLLNILKKEKDTFVYFTEAKGVRGNFRWKESDDVK